MSKKLTMADVLLACGELNKRERVAVEWVLDRAQRGLTVEEVMEVVGPLCIGEATDEAIRTRLAAKLSSK